MNESSALTDLRGAAAKRDAELHAAWRKSIDGNNQRFAWAEDVVREFLRTGIAQFTHREDYNFQQFEPKRSVLHYVRSAADVAELAVIYAETFTHGQHMGRHIFRKNTIRLTIPKRARLKGLAAPLLIAAEEFELETSHASIGKTTGPVARCDSGGLWNFYFFEDEGRMMFELFAEKAHTDPVTRVILNL